MCAVVVVVVVEEEDGDLFGQRNEGETVVVS